MKLSLYQFIALIFYAIIMGGSQIILAKASKQLGQNFSDGPLVYALFKSYWLYIAITFYIFATSFWLFILYRVDIRLAYPIASTSVIFAALIQTYIDNSIPSTSYWAGLLLVVIGLVLINLR